MSSEILRNKVRRSLQELVLHVSEVSRRILKLNSELADLIGKNNKLREENSELKNEINDLRVQIASMERELMGNGISKSNTDADHASSYSGNDSRSEVSIAELRRLLSRRDK
ncbi:hypothetical protein Cyrtocomes_00433 [Candidatus Cyrtobacter comes]|uniref:Initiation-control protein YabA n=1 Tax=Candidatus Cyrtobacter comes TaxID=675776 RepID=A0ABU5L7G0_9RICK|nr:hypothetical protein [Candidatus Cyrtobacter comes]MDZ5762066.1 hypothetical protein [Candidatus Cyrtobacter comes]